MSFREIQDSEEARRAICDGALFQVGGSLIDPGEVVRVDLSGEEPVFHLADGSTHQHDRFGGGEVGDLLAEALPYAVRQGNQSQAILPSWNRLLTPSNLLNRKFSAIINYQTSNGEEWRKIVQAESYVLGVNGDKVVRADYQGGNVISSPSINTGADETMTDAVWSANKDQPYALARDFGTDETIIYRLNSDLSNPTEVGRANISSHQDEPVYGVDAGNKLYFSYSAQSQDLVFGSYDYSTQAVNLEAQDGSRTYGVGGQFGTEFYPDASVLWSSCGTGGELTKYTKGGSIEQVDPSYLSGEAQGLAIVGDRLLIVDGGSGDLHEALAKDGTLQTTYTANLSGTLDAIVDTEAI